MFNFIFKALVVAGVFTVGYKVGRNGISNTIKETEDTINDLKDRALDAWDTFVREDQKDLESKQNS